MLKSVWGLDAHCFKCLFGVVKVCQKGPCDTRNTLAGESLKDTRSHISPGHHIGRGINKDQSQGRQTWNAHSLVFISRNCELHSTVSQIQIRTDEETDNKGDYTQNIYRWILHQTSLEMFLVRARCMLSRPTSESC